MKSIRIDTHETERGEITTYELINASGASVKLSSLGAGILEIKVPDRDGKLADVVLGYKNLEDYFFDGPCAGKVPGRFSNRICKGHLEIDGKTYQLNCNHQDKHHLHGGNVGFQNKIWDCEMDGDTVVFSLESPDGDENYPGNLTARVAYTWSDDNVLKIELGAVKERPSIKCCSLTVPTIWRPMPTLSRQAKSPLSRTLRWTSPSPRWSVVTSSRTSRP